MTIDHQRIWNETKDYIFITLGIIIYAFSWAFFLLPYEIVAGGVTGMSAIIFYATGFRVENTYIIINVLLLVIAFKSLGLKFLMKTIYAIIALYFILKLAQAAVPVDAAGHPVKILGEGQDFMSLIIGCCFTGTSLGIVFHNNGSTGGTDIIAAAVNKYHNFSIGQVLIFVDFIIIGSCFFFPQFGTIIERTHKVVFGFCTMVIENYMLDTYMSRMRQSVQFFIFSKKYQDIARSIATQLDRGVTVLDGHGWYTGQDMKVLCILAKKNESTFIFRIIKMLDPDALVSQSEVIGVYGEGFDEMKVKVSKKHQLTTNIAQTEDEKVQKE